MATYFVATIGKDTNDGSIDRPWRQPQYALDHSVPGDTIVIRGGDYDFEWHIPDAELGTLKGGKDGAWKTIEAYEGEEVRQMRRTHLYGSYIRLKGLHYVGKAYVEGIGDNIQFIGNKFTGTKDFGAIIFGVDNGLIENNHVELTSTGNTLDHCIYLAAGGPVGNYHADNMTVRGNFLSGAAGYGVHLYDERKAADDHKLVTNVLIEGNTIVNSTLRSGIVVATGPRARITDVTIRNNIIGDNALSGVAMANDASSGEGVERINIYNNTYYNNPNWDLVVGDIVGVNIQKNIFSSSKHIQNYFGRTDVKASNNFYASTPVLENITDAEAVVGDPTGSEAEGYGESGTAPTPTTTIAPEPTTTLAPTTTEAPTTTLAPPLPTTTPAPAPIEESFVIKIGNISIPITVIRNG